MSRTQRIVLLGLAAVVVVLAIVILPGGDDEKASSQPVAQTTTQEESAATPSAPTTPAETATSPDTAPEPEPKPPLLTAGDERELEFKKGDTVRFRARHSAAEEVHVHGYDVTKDLQPGKTETISFEADIEGIFEIELEHSGTPIGTLKVEPR